MTPGVWFGVDFVAGPGVSCVIPPYRAISFLLLAIRRGSGVRYLNPEPDGKVSSAALIRVSGG